MLLSLIIAHANLVGELRTAPPVLLLDEVAAHLDPDRRDEMMQKTQRRTVPQIYIGETHVGGCDDLFAIDKAGQLQSLLAGTA